MTQEPITDSLSPTFNADLMIEALKNSQQQLLSCIKLAPLSIAMFDRDMRYLATSALWIVDYGRGFTDLTGKSHYEIHPDLPARWKEIHQRGLNGETLKNDDDLWVHADGSKHWLRWSVTPWRDLHSEIGGIIISAENITERKQTEAALSAREEHFRTLFEQATDGILVTDALGKFVDANSAACRQLGYGREELLTMNATSIVLPEDVKRIVPEIERISSAHGEVVRADWQIRRKDGSIFLAEATSKQLPSGHLQAFLRDVTETRRTQMQLHERQHFLQRILDAEPGTVYIYDLNTLSNIYINRHWLIAYGYSPEEMAAMGANALTQIIFPHDQARIVEHHQAWRQVSGDEIREIEYRVRTKSGEWRWLHSRETAFTHDDAGRITQVLGIAHDITERRNAEIALRESEQRLNAAQRIGAIGCWEWDLATDLITGSQEMYRLLGVDPANTDANVFALLDRLVHPDDREEIRRNALEVRARGVITPLEFRLVTPDGSVRWMASQGQPQTDAEGNIVRFCGVVQDITARKLTEHKLAASEALLRTILDSEPACVKLIDANGTLLEINASGLAMIEAETREQLIGKDMAQFVVPEHRNAFSQLQRRVVGGASGTLEFDVTGLKGTHRTLETHAVPLRDSTGLVFAALGLTADITERKRAAAENQRLAFQLQQAQKMEAIGQLTAGIAHDFNNILASVLGYAGLAYEQHVPDKNSKLAEYLREVQGAGIRARDLIANMLAFSHNGDIEQHTLLLGPLVQETVKTLAPLLPSSIAFTARIATEGLSVLANPAQLHQVIMNLVINARDAVGEHGTIELALRQVSGVHAVCNGCHADMTGSFVELAVSDNGPGIAADILPRIFDPFYTTKRVGKGTGMGLAVVHGVVHRCGGHVLVDSQPGRGTVVRVMLPFAADASPAFAALCLPNATETVSPGHGHILVVDDEEVLAQLFGEVLKTHGYRVTVFSDSQQALLQFYSAPQEFDAVLSDQTMPGLTGVEFAHVLRARRPELPIILCTGYSAALTPEIAAQLGVTLLLKPVAFEALLTTLEQLLSAARHKDNTRNH